ncbi:DNA translocase FtsK [Acetobacter sp. AN02]|uniref:DNA translocase FtsK n=1 Tax=Acetobacter sp. AN02 TaxID=2894186 RepID=UPI00243462CC|nr:DNA translocase FtsK [Acetobacter sp. AN02]MDG6093547.1 DNA translocase FtsK [Acetobacter sp. AN02]
MSGGLTGIRRRLTEAGGVCLWLAALSLAIMLVSYNPADPSFSVATETPATNWLGWPGAAVADTLLPSIGLAAWLVVMALACWGWRIIRWHRLSVFVLRLIALVALLPVAAALLAALPLLVTVFQAPRWPSDAGIGGGIGLSAATAAVQAGVAATGPAGAVVLWVLGLILALTLAGLGLGLDRQEWRAIAAGIMAAVRFVFRQGGALLHAGVRKIRASSNTGNEAAFARPQASPVASPLAWKETQSGGPTSWTAPPVAPVSQSPSRFQPQTGPQMAAIPAGQAVISVDDDRPRPAPSPDALVRPGPPPAEEQPVIALPGPAMAQAAAPSAASRPPEPELSRPVPEPVVVQQFSSAPEEPADPAPAASRGFFSRMFSGTQDKAAQQEARKEKQPPRRDGGWQLPPLSLLRTLGPEHAQNGPSQEMLQANARLLETVLSDFGVQGRIVGIHPGPVVTLYELEPAPGIRAARVIGLADDVARSLSVLSVRIATVPGRNVMGIEVPNAVRETVYLSELFRCPEWTKTNGVLELALGKDIAGAPIFSDLAKMPHLLVAGTTGSGKSVGVNGMILSLLFRHSPDQCRLIMIDPKVLELSIYDGIPHLLTPVVTEPQKAVAALKWVVREMDRRYRNMAHLQVRNIAGYNERAIQVRDRGEEVTRRVQTGYDPETGNPIFEEQSFTIEPLPHIVVVIDEMADLMMTAGKEIDAAVQRLAQKARAAGIHVIMATQRPSVDVITGTIKANFPTRISFQVISKFDSRTILGEQGAEQLLGQGDMLFMQGGGRITRVHGPFVADSEVEAVVGFLREQGEPIYDEDVISDREDDTAAVADTGSYGGGGEDGGLYDKAVAVVIREGKASTSFVQRHLSIGYNRAAKLIEQMEKNGIVTPADHVGRRKVLIGRGAED